jgi:hypothetical protein
LRYLQQSAPDLITVAYAYFIVRQAVDRQVLAKLPIGRKLSTEVALPVTIRIDLIHHHGAMFAAVAFKITLPVTINIQPPHRTTTLHGRFPDAGVHGSTAPLYISGQANIN